MSFFKREWVPSGEMRHRWSITHRIVAGKHVFERVDADAPLPSDREMICVLPYHDRCGKDSYLVRLEFPFGEVMGVLPSRAFANFLRTTFRREVEAEVGGLEVAIYLAWRDELYYIRDGKGGYESLSKLIPLQ